MHKTITIILVSLLFLSGCASKTLITVPLDSTPLSEEKATLIIFTEETFPKEFKLMLDQQFIGMLNPVFPLKFEIEPGFHEIYAEVPMLIDRITTYEFDEGKTYYMKLWLEHGMWAGSVRIDPTYTIDGYEVKVLTRDLEKYNKSKSDRESK